MMPKTSVRPAASRNSSSPNCRPFRHCSINNSIGLRRTMDGPLGPSFLPPPVLRPAPLARSPLHRTLVVKLILTVLDDRGDGLEGEVAFRVLHHILQVKVLNRKMVVAVLVGTAHRCVVGLAPLGSHGVLLAE